MKKNHLEYAYQCKQFCYFRYEFFKRSKSYLLVQEIIKTAWQNKNAGAPGIFFDEIEETARQCSNQALKALKLDGEYSVFGDMSGAKAFVMDGQHTAKLNKDISIFDDPFLMNQKIDIPVSIKEILTIDSSMEVIKARIMKQFMETFPATIGIPERKRKADGTLASGKFLQFAKWERCLHSYDERLAGKTITEIGREIPKLWPGYNENRSNAHNKVTREIKEAERLINSAENGTFPD